VTDREEAAQNNKHLKRKILKEKIKRLGRGGGAASSQTIQKQLSQVKMPGGHTFNYAPRIPV
jgi:hypothetical protein